MKASSAGDAAPRVCAVLYPRPIKNVLRNGRVPRTAPVISPRPLEGKKLTNEITSDNFSLSEPIEDTDRKPVRASEAISYNGLLGFIVITDPSAAAS